MVLSRAARLALPCGLAMLAACTVPSPAPAPSHVLGPEMQGAANSPGHLRMATTLARCARADQQRQQGEAVRPAPPKPEQCAQAGRMSRSEQEYKLAQPQ